MMNYWFVTSHLLFVIAKLVWRPRRSLWLSALRRRCLRRWRNLSKSVRAVKSGHISFQTRRISNAVRGKIDFVCILYLTSQVCPPQDIPSSTRFTAFFHFPLDAWMFTTAVRIVRRRTGPNTRRCAHSCAWLPLTESSNGFCSKVKTEKKKCVGKNTFLPYRGNVSKVLWINLTHPSGKEPAESVWKEGKTWNATAGKTVCLSHLSGPVGFIVSTLARSPWLEAFCCCEGQC